MREQRTSVRKVSIFCRLDETGTRGSHDCVVSFLNQQHPPSSAAFHQSVINQSIHPSQLLVDVVVVAFCYPFCCRGRCRCRCRWSPPSLVLFPVCGDPRFAAPFPTRDMISHTPARDFFGDDYRHVGSEVECGIIQCADLSSAVDASARLQPSVMSMHAVQITLRLWAGERKVARGDFAGLACWFVACLVATQRPVNDEDTVHLLWSSWLGRSEDVNGGF